MIEKRIKKFGEINNYKINKEKIKELTTFGKILFNNPIRKFVIFIIINFALNIILGFFPEVPAIRLVISLIEIIIAIYFISIIVHLIKRWYNRFINPENLFVLILTYALFIIGIILFFSTLLNISELSGLGYIKYGQCKDNFSSSMITTDNDLSRETFYYTAVTFFTVGYGDICPMGFDKIISIIIAFTGHLVSVVIVALILNNYMKKKVEQ